MNNVRKIYNSLLKSFGPQGWWPVINDKTLMCEYHTNAPKNEAEVFEICLGAILTQNTAWTNVEKALLNLSKLNAIAPKSLLLLGDDLLKGAIRPAGYFNQKARKIKEFTRFFSLLKNKTPSREELLSLWGIGDETADSMLLYAFKIPVFVVDAYTKRIFSRLGLCSNDASYEELQQLFHAALSKDVYLFNEYHALIVELAKRNCTKNKPVCVSCHINKLCEKYVGST